jgi:hypothetical protein
MLRSIMIVALGDDEVQLVGIYGTETFCLELLRTQRVERGSLRRG